MPERHPDAADGPVHGVCLHVAARLDRLGAESRDVVDPSWGRLDDRDNRRRGRRGHAPAGHGCTTRVVDHRDRHRADRERRLGLRHAARHCAERPDSRDQGRSDVRPDPVHAGDLRAHDRSDAVRGLRRPSSH